MIIDNLDNHRYPMITSNESPGHPGEINDRPTRWTEVQPCHDAEPSPGWWHLVAPSGHRRQVGRDQQKGAVCTTARSNCSTSVIFPWFVNYLPSWNISNDYQWLVNYWDEIIGNYIFHNNFVYPVASWKPFVHPTMTPGLGSLLGFREGEWHLPWATRGRCDQGQMALTIWPISIGVVHGVATANHL